MGYTKRTVRVIVQDPKTDPQIVCKPDPLMLNKIDGPVRINFKLVTAGFSFFSDPGESIRIENGGDAFSGLDSNGTKDITVTDENDDHSWYLYEVSVRRDDDLTVTTDPLIINK